MRGNCREKPGKGWSSIPRPIRAGVSLRYRTGQVQRRAATKQDVQAISISRYLCTLNECTGTSYRCWPFVSFPAAGYVLCRRQALTALSQQEHRDQAVADFTSTLRKFLSSVHPSIACMNSEVIDRFNCTCSAALS
jgi:hypothetical protein